MPRLLSVDELWEAWEHVEANQGCAGSDGVRVDQFAHRAAREIETLAEQAAAAYRAFPLLRIVVEKKAGTGKTRTLLVPTVRDRVIQTAIARQLSRSFEEEFLECSYGYRPGRSVDRAIARIRKLRELGYIYVVDADIETFFDRIDHSLLLSRLQLQRIGDGVIDLLRQWISAAVWNGHRLYRLRVGVPQGSPISPLLANFFLEDFDRELEKSGKRLVRYADDFLVLAKTQPEAQQALLLTEAALEHAHLDLNKDKTRIVDFDHGFEFLGALFLGPKIWIPWKHEKRQGRIVAMAGPMPLALRTRWMFSGPRRTALEEAFRKAGGSEQLALAEKPDKQQQSQQLEEANSQMAYLYLAEQGSVLRKAGDRLLVEKDEEVLTRPALP